MKFLFTGLILSFVAMASMPTASKTPDKPKTLQEQRWEAAKVKTSKQSTVRWVSRQIERNKSRYTAVSKETGVPWFVIGCLHNMEASLSFKKHLHNGDSLTKRTWQVPKGRPKTGSPPFSWEYSAKDALFYDNMHKVNWKDLTVSLDALEKYNGWGYRRYHPETPTPYLWSFTNIYVKGKYVKDGVWSSTAVSEQVGICAILKELRVEFK